MGKKLTNEEFLERAIKLYGNDKYLYLSEYVNNRTRILIKCLVCNKSTWQFPSNHLKRKGCLKCRILNTIKTNTQFLIDAEKAHPHKFKYLTEYVRSDLEIHIECLICGDKFWKTPISHLNNGCSNCQYIGLAKTHEQFLSDLEKLYPNKFRTLSKYITSRKEVYLECLICGDKFWKVARNILNGCGCYNCGVKGCYNEQYFQLFPSKKSENSLLYFYKFTGNGFTEEFYKIGITIDKRYFNHNGRYKTELVKSIKTTLYDAFQKEQQFIEDFKEYKYIPQFKFSGWTECFKKEIYNVMFN